MQGCCFLLLGVLLGIKSLVYFCRPCKMSSKDISEVQCKNYFGLLSHTNSFVCIFCLQELFVSK